MSITVEGLRDHLPEAPLPGMIGEHPLMKEVYRLVRLVAPTELPVVIVGETGTGKELVARAIHDLSGRPGRFVAFNVCAVSDTMFEDALFGHVKGAFTSAVADAPGYLAEADHGTVLFDEISGLPLPSQAKLLRAVETREFRPIGGRADRRSDFRLVAATNAHLDNLASQGRFRRDLLERLQGVVVALPPLRARCEDVPLLAQHFAACAVSAPSALRKLDDSALMTLVEHAWPGNVRQLRHVIERAVVLATGTVVTKSEIATAVGDARRLLPAGGGRAVERTRLLQVLEAVRWDTAAAAELLGVHRVTVYRRMRRLGLEGLMPRGDGRFAPADANANPFAANGANLGEGSAPEP